MSDLPADKLFWTLEEIAELLGVTYQLIYRQVRTGALPAMRVGRVYRVRRADLEAYIDLNTSGGGGGFTCGACGTRYASRLSQKGTCPATAKPICFDCWDRKGIRSCQKDGEI
jgi:excisionase family DNA binding protein